MARFGLFLLVAELGLSQSATVCEDSAKGVMSLLQIAAPRLGSPLVAALEDGQSPGAFNCTAQPEYCGPPLNCDKPRQNPDPDGPWSYNGHADLQYWCSADQTQYRSGIIDKCILGNDLNAAGFATYATQEANVVLDLDGSYCFLARLCLEDRVTNHTTLEEAEAICDARYGHEGWTTNFTKKYYNQVDALGSSVGWIWDRFDGFKSRAVAEDNAKLACAMGNFHCDVQYCRETYCVDPVFLKKYGRYLFVDAENADMDNWSRGVMAH